MNRFRFPFATIIGVGIVSILIGFSYVAVQQSLRLSANNPQIKMAEDLRLPLSHGHKIEDKNPIDVSHSLTPFVMVYDSNTHLVASQAILDGVPPALPEGVFLHVPEKGEKMFTWQPKPGVRIATIVTAYSGLTSGYILVGRSLREVEKRINQLTIIAGLSWLGSIILCSILYFVVRMNQLNRK
jgi:hypothetical protein